jgi:hypothetical protein
MDAVRFDHLVKACGADNGNSPQSAVNLAHCRVGN